MSDLTVFIGYSSSSRAPKPNTRFLKSLVRDVDGHNTTLLREQANAARAAAADKFYKDPSLQPGNGERRGANSSARSQHTDPDVARMKRLFGGAVGNAANSRKNDTSAARNSVGSSSRRHAPSHSESRQIPSTSASKYGGAAGSWRRETTSHTTSRFNYEDEASEDEEKGWSRKDVGRSKPRSAMKRAEEEAEEQERRRKRSSENSKADGRAKERERSRSPVSPGRRRVNVDEPRRSLPPDDVPLAAPSIPSKMDRYFEPTYDPKKDYRAMLDAQDVAVPRTGLVPNIDIGWDSMLSTIKYRGQEKDRHRERDREKERAAERDRRERERAREHRSKSSREKERSGREAKSRSKRDRSPSVISIRDSSDESPSGSDSGSESDSWSSSSSSHRHRKRKHGSSSKRSKDRSTKKSSSSSKRQKSGKSSKKRRGYESDDSEKERERKKVLVGGYEYVSKGAVREWDRGK